MKSTKRLVLACVCIAIVVVLVHYANTNLPKKADVVEGAAAPIEKLLAPSRLRDEKVFICVVVCGDRVDESLTMIKSALVFSRRTLHFIVIADPPLMPAFEEKLSDWKELTNDTKMDYTIKPISFPHKSDTVWRKLFKPCAAQRLFLPV